MAELSYIIKSQYQESLTSLKNSSYDKQNDIYLCQSNMEVVDFDALTLKLYPQKQPSSYDTLIIEEDKKELFCVEFKNQEKADINRQKLHKKVIDSDTTLKKIYNENNIKKSSYKHKLCIVYKKDEQFAYRRFRDNIIHFGLQEYKPKYIDEIITNDIIFFQKEFKNRYGCRVF
jgi:hypothetical protein